MPTSIFSDTPISKLGKLNFTTCQLNRKWHVAYGQQQAVIEADCNDWVDFIPAFQNAIGNQTPIVATQEFTAAADGDVLFSAGSDWFMEVTINGEIIMSTMKGGNIISPCSVDSHQFITPVHAGSNTLTIKVKSGSLGCGFGIKTMIPTMKLLWKAMSGNELTEAIPGFSMIKYGPYLSNPTDGAVTVNFVMIDELVGAVDFRLAGTGDWNRRFFLRDGQARNDVDYCNIRLDHLLPGREYEYRLIVYQTFPLKENIIPTIHKFTAPPAKKEYSFFCISDTQAPISAARQAIVDFNENCGQKESDYYMGLGDISNGLENAEDSIFNNWLNLLPAEQLASQPMVFVRGNHDMRGCQSGKYHRYCALSNGKTYGMFQLGDACFIVLDALEDKPRSDNPALMTYFNYESSLIEEQTRWFAQAVESDTFINAKWRIVLCHAFEHGNANYDAYEYTHIRHIVNNAFSGKNPKIRLHLWLAAHTHQYARTIPFSNAMKFCRQEKKRDYKINGQHLGYTTVVNDGPSLDGLGLTAIKVTVHDDNLEITSLTRDGQIFDHFAIAPDGAVTELPVDVDALQIK